MRYSRPRLAGQRLRYSTASHAVETIKLLLGDMTLTGEGKRFSLTAFSFHLNSKRPGNARDKRLFPTILICIVAKVLGRAHNKNKAGREGVGCAG